MKKSVIASGVIIALGTIWIGATWYTGKVAEEQYQAQINLSNQKLAKWFKNSQDSVKVELTKFERSLFSSDVATSVVIKSAQENKTLTIPFTAKFYHGPLPLNRLARFNVIPAMFSADVELAKNEQTQLFFGKHNKSPITTHFSMGYDKRMKGESGIELDVEIDGGQLSGKMVGEFDVDSEGYGWGEAKSEQWKIILPKDPATSDSLSEGTIEFNDIAFRYDLNTPPKEYPQLLLGEYQIRFGNIKAAGKKTTEDFYMQLEDVDAKFDSKLLDKFVNIGLTYNIGGWDSKQGQGAFALGKLGWHMEFNHLEPKSVNTILSEFSKVEPNMPAAKISSEGEEAMKVILKHQPQFKLEPLSLVNRSGKLEINLNIALANDNFDLLARRKILDLLKEFNLNLVLDKPALLELFTSVLENQQKVPAAEAKRLAESQLETFLQQIRQQELFVEDEKSIKLHLELKGDKLDFNGRLLSQDELNNFIAGAAAMSQENQ